MGHILEVMGAVERDGRLIVGADLQEAAACASLMGLLGEVVKQAGSDTSSPHAGVHSNPEQFGLICDHPAESEAQEWIGRVPLEESVETFGSLQLPQNLS